MSIYFYGFHPYRRYLRAKHGGSRRGAVVVYNSCHGIRLGCKTSAALGDYGPVDGLFTWAKVVVSIIRL